jgi:hypothetical protein
VLKLLLSSTASHSRYRRATGIAAVFGLLLASCAGDVPIPFMNTSLPPAPANPPDYPNLGTPNPDQKQVPVLTDSERQAVEDQLKQLVQDRENNVKKRIDKSN